MIGWCFGVFKQESFLYLTTIGWKTQNPHEIEIWFVAYQGCFYLLSEKGQKAHWVQNIQHQARVLWRVAGHHYAGHGRVLDAEAEYELVHHIWTLMDEKYQWSNGLAVELCPDSLN